LGTVFLYSQKAFRQNVAQMKLDDNISTILFEAGLTGVWTGPRAGLQAKLYPKFEYKPNYYEKV